MSRLFGVAAILIASIGLRAHTAEPAGQQPPKPAPVQPLPYSHRQHLALPGVSCALCHLNPDPGALMTYPATSICLSCHATIPARTPALQQLAAFAASGKPIPWVRVYQVPDFVYWSHRPHVIGMGAAGPAPTTAGTGTAAVCVQCHGPVPERDVISRETNVSTMNGCISCHDERQVSSDCGFCHEPRQ